MIFREVGDHMFQAIATARLGAAHAARGDGAAADEAFARARDYFEGDGAGWGLAALRTLELLRDPDSATVPDVPTTGQRHSFLRLARRLLEAARR